MRVTRARVNTPLSKNEFVDRAVSAFAADTPFTLPSDVYGRRRNSRRASRVAKRKGETIDRGEAFIGMKALWIRNLAGDEKRGATYGSSKGW